MFMVVSYVQKVQFHLCMRTHVSIFALDGETLNIKEYEKNNKRNNKEVKRPQE